MKFAAVSLALVALVVVIYYPVHGFDFLVFDDDFYLVYNPTVKDGLTWSNVKWAFTTFHHSNWHPVTWLSYLLEIEFFGLDPGPMHVSNAVIHAANTLLLLFVLVRFTGRLWPSAIVAALFAVHPLHVESVAWVSERKDVLSTFFALLVLLAYDQYTRKPSVAPYGLVVVLFALGLMAKPMLVTLPFVLLLLDYWPLREGRPSRGPRRVVLEKVPLLLLSAASSVVTVLAQLQGEAITSVQALPVYRRMSNAVVSYALYLYKTVWPTELAAFYPISDQGPSAQAVAAAAAVLIVITTGALYLRKSKPYVIVGWLWFLGTLVPVIGLVQVGAQSMADRYTYIPLIGVFFAVVWLAADWVGNVPWRRATATFAAVFSLTALTALAVPQARYWKDTETLFRRALEVTENNVLAHNNLGMALLATDKAEAEHHFRIARALRPSFWKPSMNLGNVLLDTGRPAEAIEPYLDALQYAPTSPIILTNLGLALERLGRLDEAKESYIKALQADPRDINARLRLAMVLLTQKRFEECIEQYRNVLGLAPDNPDALTNTGVALIGLKKFEAAKPYFHKVLRSNPNHVNALVSLGVAEAELGNREQARQCFTRALELDPDHQLAQRNLAALEEEEVP